MPRKRIKLGVGLMVAGMAATYLVAWAFALSSSTGPSHDRYRTSSRFPRWDVFSHEESSGAIEYQQWVIGTDQDAEPWAARFSPVPVREPPEWCASVTAPSPEQIASKTVVIDLAFGWPLRAVASRWTLEQTTKQGHLDWGVSLRNYSPWRDDLLRCSIVPLRPLWVEFFVDSLFYAVLLTPLWVALRAAIKTIRIDPQSLAASMRTCRRWIAGLFIAGMATTYVVAWTIALWPRGGIVVLPFVLGHPVRTNVNAPCWFMESSQYFGFTVYSQSVIGSEQDLKPLLDAGVPVGQSPEWCAAATSPTVEQIAAKSSVNDSAAGWPMQALTMRLAGAQESPMNSEGGCVSVYSLVPWADETLSGCWLPLRPRWFEFCVDSAFFTAMFIAFWFVIAIVKIRGVRATRVRRGACLKCGYPMTGTVHGTVCPECGSPIVRRMP